MNWSDLAIQQTILYHELMPNLKHTFHLRTTHFRSLKGIQLLGLQELVNFANHWILTLQWSLFIRSDLGGRHSNLSATNDRLL